jgi:hypothetical protein
MRVRDVARTCVPVRAERPGCVPCAPFKSSMLPRHHACLQCCRYAACPGLRHIDPPEFVLAWIRGVLAAPESANDLNQCFRNAGVGPGADVLPASSLGNGCACANTKLHVLPVETHARNAPPMNAMHDAMGEVDPLVERWFHGTSEASALAIIRRGVDFDCCEVYRDFGGGKDNWKSFYVSNNLRQAYLFAAAKFAEPAVLQFVWLCDAARLLA